MLQKIERSVKHPALIDRIARFAQRPTKGEAAVESARRLHRLALAAI
jgi:hypothetical protein